MLRLDGIHIDDDAAYELEQRLKFEESQWAYMLSKYGAVILAQKITKLKSFRDYTRAYPYDLTQVQYDSLYAEDGQVLIEDKRPSVEDEVDVRMRMDKAIDSLSTKQKKVWELMKQGKTHEEIAKIMKFNSTGPARWHKHQIKKAISGED